MTVGALLLLSSLVLVDIEHVVKRALLRMRELKIAMLGSKHGFLSAQERRMHRTSSAGMCLRM